MPVRRGRQSAPRASVSDARAARDQLSRASARPPPSQAASPARSTSRDLDLDALLERDGRVSPGRSRRTSSSSGRRSSCSAQLGWQTVNAYEEMLGPDGTLGRDSRRDVVLAPSPAPRAAHAEPGRARRRARGGGRRRVARDRSLMDPTRANREVYDLLRDGYLASWRDDDGERAVERGSRTSTGVTRRATTGWPRTRCGSRATCYRRRVDLVLFVNGIPLVLMEFKEREPAGARRVTTTTCATTGTRSRSCSCRTAFVIVSNGSRGAGRRDVRAVGALRRLEADRRRGQARPGRAGDGDPRHLRAGAAARPRRELRRLHASGPAGSSSRGAQPPGARRERGDRGARAHPRDGREAARASSGTRRVGQEPLDAVVHAEGAAAARRAAGPS